MSAGEHGSRRGRRILSAAERALWRGVARSVKPLRPPSRDDADADETDALALSAVPSALAPITSKPLPASARPVKSPPPLARLERRETQKLVRGSAAIDARIDLHGMTQAQAHAALARFLRRAQHDGARFVLVITGKGARMAERDGERGVLRRQVPLWLRLPEFRDAIIGFEEAHIAHGGEGALYVRLRKGRD
jgi:DNA-nicking Smr family endonuclease